jgi:deoxyribodipyrimidine photolyase-like uncharacterized protein
LGSRRFLNVMRHFARTLEANGYRVRHVSVDAPGPAGFGAMAENAAPV